MRTEASDCGISTLAFYSATLWLFGLWMAFPRAMPWAIPFGAFGAGKGRIFWPHPRSRLFFRNSSLTAPLCADVLAPGAPAKWQIGYVINTWIEFNHVIQADKPAMIRVIGCAT